MTEDFADEQQEHAAETVAPEPDASEGPVRTGNQQVDAVLASLEALDGAPVEEHVAVFERAHEQLRAALDAQPARPAVQPGAPRPADA